MPSLRQALTLVVAVWAASAQSASAQKTPSPRAKRVLVVTYSKTGTTLAMAAEIIRRFDADSRVIRAPSYDSGKRSASSDAWDERRRVPIVPKTIDMSRYDLIFLGSPIWWYRPAVPLWAFVENNSFNGKKVVLFNSFNSRFKDKHITQFKKLVRKKGGVVVEHLYVRRGRWYWQKSRKEVLKELNASLDKKKAKLKRLIKKVR